MRTESVDPISDARWSEFVERTRATVFHHPAWLGLLADQYGYELAACCVVGDEGRIVAGIPWARVDSRLTGRRLVALPFSDSCPPLFDGGAPEQLAAAIEAQTQSIGLGLELRARLEPLEAPAPHRFWQHTLALGPDAAAVESAAKSSIRRGVAKARREGLAVERRTDPEALDAFYRLHLRTRRHQGVPTQSKRFIRGLLGLFEHGRGFVALVSDAGAPLAAAVFLRQGGHLTYKYGASERSALPRRPNNLLFADVIRWGCENGLHTLDFGRTDLDNEGLRSFKRAWGTEESPLHYTYVGMPPPDSDEGRSTRLLASAIRHSPPVLGRAVGAALYRHFG